MAKKNRTVFMCTDCGNEYAAWQGRCDYCGAWNTIVEQKVNPIPESDTRRRVISGAKPLKLSEVGSGTHRRIGTGIGELDRVLGGGMVPGSMTLISGEPGIGKSTLIIQAANRIASHNGNVIYATGEESEEQVKMRADRVCGDISDDIYIFPETNIENIVLECEKIHPSFLVIDSIQTMYSSELDAIAGNITQVRTCAGILMKFAKMNNVPVFIVAHVNKSGDLAGPKTIEHMVDCVLSFAGERDQDLRILRSKKNRFGTTDEIGAFRMSASGMEEVGDLSTKLLENPGAREEGSVVSAIYEGSRPIFFEVQALVTPANVGFARRTSVGIDINRLNMILAVLEKKSGISLINQDVYVNVVGGMRPGSTSADLAVALAIYSSYNDKTAAKRTVTIGEVGLTGDLRSVSNVDKIIMEAVRLGYESIILPQKNAAKCGALSKSVHSIQILGAGNLNEAIKRFVSGD